MAGPETTWQELKRDGNVPSEVLSLDEIRRFFTVQENPAADKRPYVTFTQDRSYWSDDTVAVTIFEAIEASVPMKKAQEPCKHHSQSIIERFRERQALRSPLRETGLKMFNHMTKGFKVIHAIERKYPTSRGFIAMIQRKRLLKFCTWTMRERRKKRAAAAAASDRLTADEAMIEAGLEAVAPDELHIIDENPAAPCGSAESPAPSTAPSVMSISSEEEESRKLFERMHNLTEQWKRESNREPGDEQGSSKRLKTSDEGHECDELSRPASITFEQCIDSGMPAAAAIAASAPPVAMDSSFDEPHFHDPSCDERSPSSDSRLPHWQPGGVAYERAASRMRSETAPVPSFLSDEERRSSRVERGPHKAKEPQDRLHNSRKPLQQAAYTTAVLKERLTQQPKAPAVRAPPAAPPEPVDLLDAPLGSCIRELLR